MKQLLIAAAFFIAAQAEARSLTCVFTEPFLGIKVSEEARKVSITNEIEKTTENYKILKIAKKGNATQVVFGVNIEENYSLTYVKDGKGSNGMSDDVYPYSAQLSVGDTRPQHGGCH